MPYRCWERIYEDNLVDIKKAIKWDREFLENYADSRQVPFYKEKIASLGKAAEPGAGLQDMAGDPVRQ